VFCGERDCGRRLPPGFPNRQACAWCGGSRRHYEFDLQASLDFTGRINTVRQFWRQHPVWFVVQTGLAMLSVMVGFAGLFFSLRILAMAGFVVGAAITVLGVMLPPWRERVEEHRWQDP
jgi:hypothetical protein